MPRIELPACFADVKQLPALPHDVHHLIKALADDGLDYAGLARVLETHPTICSRLIALANSAWINNNGEPVTSIERTCFKLGLNIVRGVSIGLAVMKPFNVYQCRSFDIRRYWASSMLAAQAATELARALPDAEVDEAFVQTVHTAGILHNLGLLCLADTMAAQTQEALQLKQANPQWHLNQALRKTAATDYCEIGAYLAQYWGIPDALVTSIEHHRHSGYRGDYWRQALIVGAATRMVGALFKDGEMPALELLAVLAISENAEQRCFAHLQAEFAKTQELAKVLFG
ncbi:HDOD domain-containing protein [Methylomonas sp. DH-1]|uniref:HDOD domain-containing protein n=1 Tax=Methylomonas sp. (strain DH-1) TaxID=1727196 RepID=UPI0007C9426E|nr:HDOD domain-containing protein [Methylomonas sp. DH-1]ANE55731.1 hypothetical protein AYM39_11435 [Methylomonas sp. DH-1]